jgi:hypothetical protein
MIEAATMSKCKHWQSHYDSLYTVSKKNSYWVSLFERNDLLAKVCFSYDLSTLLLSIVSFFVFNRSAASQSQLFLKELSVQVEISE